MDTFVDSSWYFYRYTDPKNDKLAENQVDIVRPEQGAWPPPDRQLLIERNSLSLTGASIGDTVIVETSDGKQHELKIAGTTHDLNKPPAQFTNQVYGYVNFDTLQRLGFPNNYNEIHIVVTGDRYNKDHVNDVATLVKNRLEGAGLKVNFIYVPLKPGEHPANDIIQTFLLILGVLGGTILALAAGLATAQRAIRPIAALTDAAREVERTRDPSRRLPRPEADDEVAELARTLEDMLSALDSARTDTEAMLDRHRDLLVALGVAVQDHQGRIDSGLQGGQDLAASCDIEADSFLDHHALHRGAGKCL